MKVFQYDSEFTFDDLFCGAGGSITGMKQAGFKLVAGANHSVRAIETASTNNPEAEFLCTDINHYDMRRLPKADVLWASVICTEMSPAGGNKKLRGQGRLDLEEQGHVPSDAYERTRACALDVIRATEVHRYKAVIVENVVEFARDWELYDWWVEGMVKLGYQVQVANLSAAHIYGEGNDPAPQWRDRIYIVFTRSDIPLPDLEPRPPARCEPCDKVVESRQFWKKVNGRRIGKYGSQYLYACPTCSGVVEPYVLPALAAVDLTDVGERIGDRKKPLAKNTMARIQWGAENLTWPVVAQVAGNTYERPGYHRAWPAAESPLTARQATGCDAVVGPLVVNSNHDDMRVFPASMAPFSTRSTKIGDGIAIPAFYVKNYGAIDEAQYRAHPLAGEPFGAQTTTAGTTGIVSAPFLTMLRTNGLAIPLDEPMPTLATGRNHYLTTPPFMVKNYGGNAQPRHLCKPLTDPMGTITAIDHHALVLPYRKGQPKSVMDPFHTLATRPGEAIVQPVGEIDLDDWHYRMIRPREGARGQRFPDSYIITGNVGEQTAQVGNAVPCNTAQFVGERLMAVLVGAA